MRHPRVLFLCTGNSARSIIGAALLRQMAGDRFDVFSAGTHPKGINAYTARVLAPLAIDVTGERSKSVAEFDGQTFDYVITVCDQAAEECPVFPGAPVRIHWNFADPAAVTGSDAERLAAFQRTLREMRTRLSTFVIAAGRNGPGDCH
ncbi:MAG TPA: arsenate reductase ArsC [Dehalococcoidia bacterium]|nr:arsenate reductase ArsC [Dehalococcoidia bacterium]